MTKRQSQQLIRKYLKGNRKPTISKHSVLYWWKICNRAFFNNRLTQPKQITIKKFHDKYGYCKILGINQHNVEIAVATWIDTREDFIGTLVHEMIHQWQYYHHGVANHGQTFRCWLPVFEEFSFSV